MGNCCCSAPLSPDYRVTANGTPIDIYDGGYTRWGGTGSFGYFHVTGRAEVGVTATDGIAQHNTSWSILPRKYRVRHEEIENENVRFRIDRPMKRTFVRLNDYQGRVPHLFANRPEQNAPDKDDKNVIWFGPGLHEVGADKNWTVTLNDNQTVYLAGDAYVRGVI